MQIAPVGFNIPYNTTGNVDKGELKGQTFFLEGGGDEIR